MRASDLGNKPVRRNNVVAEPLSEAELEIMGLNESVSYSYHCLQCDYEDEVPDVVVDGFAASADLKPGRMPRLVCPNCGGSFRAVGQTREQSER